MKYSAILLSAIAVSGAMAAPQLGADNVRTSRLQPKATIQLDDKVEHSVTNYDSLTKFSFGGFGDEATFKKVTLTLNPKNDKLRCRANDKDGKPIVVLRGKNTDYTFAQGPEWEFQPAGKPAAVAEVICDANFKQTPPNQQDKIVVELSAEKDSPNPVSIIIEEGRLEADVQDTTAFNYVTLKIGPKVFSDKEALRALRCQILSGGTEISSETETQNKQQPIVVNRGENKNKVTFGDGLKGAWTFTTASSVSKIVCGDKIIKPDPETPTTLPATGGNIPPATGNMPPASNNMPPTSTNVPPVPEPSAPVKGYQRNAQN